RVIIIDPNISHCQKITSILGDEHHIAISSADDSVSLIQEQSPQRSPADFWIINQEILPKLAAPPRGQYIVLANDVRFDQLHWAYEQGALGYLLASAPANLWRSAIQLPPGHFLIDPSVAPLLFSDVFPSHRLHAELSQLTAREREILSLLAAGCSNKEIAAQLGISQTTVKTHIAHIYRKLDIRGRASKCSRYPLEKVTAVDNSSDERDGLLAIQSGTVRCWSVPK
ncbi:response regulator transcription factor, partial [Thermogemmatispora sp.]|uniref:response regulator transcription factor n=1 Tax=Thermogemmatispora sp. TaxID=1968838 RepID=UPI001D224947